MLQKEVFFCLTNGIVLNGSEKQMQQSLFDCRTQPGGTVHQCCAVFEMCEGEWSWVQLRFAAWALFLVPTRSGECIERSSCHDLQRYLPNYLPTWASRCCLKSRTQRPQISRDFSVARTFWGLFLKDHPTCFFMIFSPSFCLFLSFQGELKKMKWDRGAPCVLPFLSLGLCCKGTCHPLILSWHCRAVALKMQVQQEPKEVQPLISHTAPQVMCHHRGSDCTF